MSLAKTRAGRQRPARSTRPQRSSKTVKKPSRANRNQRPSDPPSIKGAEEGAPSRFRRTQRWRHLRQCGRLPGERWIHEIKFDGYRLQVRIEAGRVKLLTRTGLDWTKKFGKELVAAFQDLPVGTALIDGELVVETAAGASDFSALQADLSADRTDGFVFYVFDLLHLDGFDLQDLPLVERKALLQKLIADARGPIRFSEHFDEDGAAHPRPRLPARPGRHRFQASRRAISLRPRQELAQIQMLTTAGIRHRGLRAIDDIAQGYRLACHGRLQRQET